MRRILLHLVFFQNSPFWQPGWENLGNLFVDGDPGKECRDFLWREILGIFLEEVVVEYDIERKGLHILVIQADFRLAFI